MSTMTILAAVLTLSEALGAEPPPDSTWALLDAAVSADGEHRREILEVAEERARDALAEDETSVERRYAVAVVLGARANTEEGRAKVRAAAELHELLVTILYADPGHVGARHLLGRLHAGVRRMGGMTRWVATNLLGGGVLKRATWAGAEENLAYAEANAPEVPDHHLQLALLYRDTGRPDPAVEELRHVLALEARGALDRAVQSEARRVREGLED